MRRHRCRRVFYMYFPRVNAFLSTFHRSAAVLSAGAVYHVFCFSKSLAILWFWNLVHLDVYKEFLISCPIYPIYITFWLSVTGRPLLCIHITANMSYGVNLASALLPLACQLLQLVRFLCQTDVLLLSIFVRQYCRDEGFCWSLRMFACRVCCPSGDAESAGHKNYYALNAIHNTVLISRQDMFGIYVVNTKCI